MMLGKEDILSRTNRGLGVFRYYIKGDWKVGRKFRNPFYDDTKASCYVYFDRQHNLYRYKDFGNAEYGGDCFDLVAKLNRLDCNRSFVEVLSTIKHDLCLNIDVPTKPYIPIKPVDANESRSSVGMPVVKEFNQAELAFWATYGIDANTLQWFNVASVERFSGISKEGKPYTVEYTVKEPVFAYLKEESAKYYRPRSNVRFMYGGQKEREYMFGWEQLPAKGEIVFITGGEKDVMSLFAQGFAAICFNSETANIPKRIVTQLSFRFRHVVILYDCDKTGLESSLRHQGLLSEFEVKRLILPLKGDKSEKDVSDYFRLGYERRDLLKLFSKLLDEQSESNLTLLHACAVDFSRPPSCSTPLITINNEVIATPSNLVCVTGNEGSGKSSYVGAIIASALNTDGRNIDTLGTYIAPNTDGKAILVYDTEQTEEQLYRNTKSVFKRADIALVPKWFKAFGIGIINRNERLNAIVESIDSYYYRFGGIHLVVIDGVADLITSVNDEGESVRLVEELHHLAGFYKTCIVVVLHLSPTASKLRGHLGSEIQRKASGIISIDKVASSGNSSIKAIKVREGNAANIPSLQFAWCEQFGYHVLVDKPIASSKVDLNRLTKELFLTNQPLTYSDMCASIQDILGVKERQAKNYIKWLKNAKLIKQSDTEIGIYVLE